MRGQISRLGSRSLWEIVAVHWEGVVAISPTSREHAVGCGRVALWEKVDAEMV